jgi:hypothetical protein
MGRKVAIFKRENYMSNSNLFNLNNVYLFDNVDINSIISAPIYKSDFSFFKIFDNYLFDEILKK